MLISNEQRVVGEQRAVPLHSGGVYILVTSVQGNLMAAAFTTREAAMAAAVDWVEGEAETRLSGSLDERYNKAWRYVEGHGGKIEIVVSPEWSSKS